MDQLRQVGEVLGSLMALMVFKEEIMINKNQCCLLFDVFNLAFQSINQEIKQTLRFDERNTKWRALESPLKEMLKIFRDGEQYIRNCLEAKDWWAKSVALSQNTDFADIHIHNLLWCLPVVFEAIENIAEITGNQQEEIQMKKILFSKKYDKDWIDPMLFQLNFGKQYLVSQELCRKYQSVWKEDQWVRSEMLSSKGGSLSKQESRLAELLVNPRGKFFPISVLVGTNEYHVRRRFGSDGQYKEVQWMGESFAVRHLFGDLEQVKQEIPLLQSLSHPNVMHVMYAFANEEKKECYLVMDLMNKDLASHIKEVCSPRRKLPFPLLRAVDVMLQIARGMEYLHSKNIYHGDLNPNNILVKSQSSLMDGCLHVKVSGFGLSPTKSKKASAGQVAATDQCIWHAPEVLLEQDQSGDCSSKLSEKADVYSFAMICFELLTGKVPFEDSHLQGDKISKNIKAGERPLFPFPSPKYLTSLTKRCWHSDPLMRPSFSSICRVLRYIKRFLVMNPDHGEPDSPVPSVDYFDVERSLCKRLKTWDTKENQRVSAIPLQMFAYRVIEREKNNLNLKEKSLDTASSEDSVCGDENLSVSLMLSEDSMSTSMNSSKSSSLFSSESSSKKESVKKLDVKTSSRQSGARQTQPASCGHSLRMKPESKLRSVLTNQGRRRTSPPGADLA